MKLYFAGHDYKYAVEQILLMLFPTERPEYPDAPPEPGDSYARVRICSGPVLTTATALICAAGKTGCGIARVRSEALNGGLVTQRLRQRIIKLAFYKAAVAVTGQTPVWGALTGIRPAKLATRFLEEGMNLDQAQAAMQREFFVAPERARLCVAAASVALTVDQTLTPTDIALYVGIPFCPTRCAYCSFVSNSVEKSAPLIPPFLEALDREMDETGRVAAELGLQVKSVYLGGGTPTTLSASQLQHVIARLRSTFDLSQIREFTVEAGRPDTITAEKLETLAANGVDRISINPQRMSDAVLRAIGRRHTAAEIRTAFAAARAAGFKRINMDLIAGLPSDTPDGFSRSLAEVLALEPENVTVHTLALKKGSRITEQAVPIPDGAAVGAMLDDARAQLTAHHYAPYYLYRQKFTSGGFENVGWSMAECENLYNICIMEELCTILAMGGGGSTKLVKRSSGRIERIFDPKYPLEYIQNIDRVLADKEKIRIFCLQDR
jgi:oxygen-independent coproporphyrinogen-3 oxidase